MFKKLFGKSMPQPGTPAALPDSIRNQVTTLDGVQALLVDRRSACERLPGPVTGPRRDAMRRQIQALEQQEAWLRWQAAGADADERYTADRARLSRRLDEVRKASADAQAHEHACRERLAREAATLADLQALKAVVDADAQQREQAWRAQRDEAAAARDIDLIEAVLKARPEAGFQAALTAPHVVAIVAAQARVGVAEKDLAQARQSREQAEAESTAIEFGIEGLEYDLRCRQFLQQWLRMKKSTRPEGSRVKLPKQPDVAPVDPGRVPELKFLASASLTQLEAPDLGALAIDLAAVPVYSTDPVEEERRATEALQAQAHKAQVLTMRNELQQRFGVNWRQHVDQGHPALDPAVIG